MANSIGFVKGHTRQNFNQERHVLAHLVLLTTFAHTPKSEKNKSRDDYNTLQECVPASGCADRTVLK